MTKGERTRQSIIESAAPLFNQRGFLGCSITDVMEVTGLEKGCLYRHFENKEELACEVFRYSLQRVFEARGITQEESGSAVTRLRGMVERFVEVPSPLPGGCPLLNTAVDADDGNPALRKLVRDALGDWKRKVCAIVKRGVEAGEIKAETDSKAIANMLIAMLEGASMIARLEGNRTALKDAQFALNSLIDGIVVGQS
jgi:TetR/AcrR family transcriptional repressor of nem operon